MSANRFVLEEAGVEVDYPIGGNPSFPALTYKNGAVVKTFLPEEGAIETTALIPFRTSIRRGARNGWHRRVAAFRYRANRITRRIDVLTDRKGRVILSPVLGSISSGWNGSSREAGAE